MADVGRVGGSLPHNNLVVWKPNVLLLTVTVRVRGQSSASSRCLGWCASAAGSVAFHHHG